LIILFEKLFGWDRNKASDTIDVTNKLCGMRREIKRKLV